MSKRKSLNKIRLKQVTGHMMRKVMCIPVQINKRSRSGTIQHVQIKQDFSDISKCMNVRTVQAAHYERFVQKRKKVQIVKS